MSIQAQHILITGGAGFIGSHLAEKLADDNQVRIVDDFSTGSRNNLTTLSGCTNVEVIEGDITNTHDAGQWCRGIDIVFHLAVSCLRSSLSDPQQSHDVNAGGTLNLCLAALNGQVRKFVYVSSSEIYGSAQHVPMSETHPTEPVTVYGAAKLAGELYAKSCHRTYGLPVVIVRPFNTYGPREPWRGRRAEVIPRFMLQRLAGRPPVIFGDGRQTRDFTYVDDTVTGIVQAAECDALIGDAVNIAAGRELTIKEVAAQVTRVLDTDGSLTYAPARPGDVARHWADISKARELLRFEPTTSIDDGLRRSAEWLKANVYEREESFTGAGAANW